MNDYSERFGTLVLLLIIVVGVPLAYTFRWSAA